MFVYREEPLPQVPRTRPRQRQNTAKWMEKMERVHRRAEAYWVEKHRHGATNKIDLMFDDRYTRFSSYGAGWLI